MPTAAVGAAPTLGWDGAVTIVVLGLGLIVMMADWLQPHLTFTLMVTIKGAGRGSLGSGGAQLSPTRCAPPATTPTSLATQPHDTPRCRPAWPAARRSAC